MVNSQFIPMVMVFTIIKIILVIIGAFLTIKLVSITRRKVEKGINTANHKEDQITQIDTFLMVSEYILRVTIIFIAVIWVLTILGVDIVPIITTVGVAGLAITLGAQTIIKDYVGGIIILIENMYYVGDTITVATNTGKVTKITLRATYLVDNEQRMIIIPNGDIRTLITDQKIRETNNGDSQT